MRKLVLEATRMSPAIEFDNVNGELIFTGKMYPSNAAEFFTPIFELVDEFIRNNNSLTINFKITYLNSSSTKLILKMFENLIAYKKSGKNIVINWYFDEVDDDMREIGEDLIELIPEIPINVVEIRA